jgi:KDO2-lipid IV(A) lauroyltransferase
MGGHVGNWEWGGMAVGNFSPMHNVAVYLPLKNKWADKMMRKTRSRLTKVDDLVASPRLYKTLSLCPRPFQVYILSDQSPPRNSFVRVPFLNIPTAFFAGTPKMIRKLGVGLVYLETVRVRSGFYEVRLTLLTEEGSRLTEVELTNLYAQALESSIIKAPSDWLWSHKRWKF